MQKISLDQTQLSQLILDNKYPVNQKTKFVSRCIDGRYENDDSLPALAFPGGDAGELALILATANSSGFEVDKEAAYKSLVEAVGEEKNLSFHTDSHAEKGMVVAGCGHIKQMTLTPQDYHLSQDDIKFIKNKCRQALEKGAQEAVLAGDHQEAAVVYIKGDYGLLPQYTIKDADIDTNVQIFIYHQSLVDMRHRLLAKNLIKNKAYTLPKGLDEDYLYQILSDMVDVHTLETVKRLAKGLPIYQVIFDDKGMFEIEELGVVK